MAVFGPFPSNPYDPERSNELETKRHAGKVKANPRLLAELLGFPHGVVKAVSMMDYLDEVVFVIEDKSMPESVPGREVEMVHDVVFRTVPVGMGRG